MTGPQHTPTIMDGHQLRSAWSDRLRKAQLEFRSLLVSSPSSWKVVPMPKEITSPSASEPRVKGKGSQRPLIPDVQDVIIHRRTTKTGEVLRAVLEMTLPPDDSCSDLDSWKALLSTPEMRKHWDPSVQDGRIVEMFDPDTRITKIDFILGWPARFDHQ